MDDSEPPSHFSGSINFFNHFTCFIPSLCRNDFSRKEGFGVGRISALETAMAIKQRLKRRYMCCFYVRSSFVDFSEMRMYSSMMKWANKEE